MWSHNGAYTWGTEDQRLWREENEDDRQRAIAAVKQTRIALAWARKQQALATHQALRRDLGALEHTAWFRLTHRLHKWVEDLMCRRENAVADVHGHNACMGYAHDFGIETD